MWRFDLLPTEAASADLADVVHPFVNVDFPDGVFDEPLAGGLRRMLHPTSHTVGRTSVDPVKRIAGVVSFRYGTHLRRSAAVDRVHVPRNVCTRLSLRVSASRSNGSWTR